MAVLLLSLVGVSLAADDPYTDQQLIAESMEYRTVHPSELTILKQVTPKFPGKADKEGYRHEECTAQIYVGEKGRPDTVEVLPNCPEVFHKSIEKAVSKWRFEPVIGEDGLPEAVTFVLRLRFQK